MTGFFPATAMPDHTFHGVPDKTGLARTVREVLASRGRFVVVNWYPMSREETQVLGSPVAPPRRCVALQSRPGRMWSLGGFCSRK